MLHTYTHYIRGRAKKTCKIERGKSSFCGARLNINVYGRRCLVRGYICKACLVRRYLWKEIYLEGVFG